MLELEAQVRRSGQDEYYDVCADILQFQVDPSAAARIGSMRREKGRASQEGTPLERFGVAKQGYQSWKR